MLTYLPRDAIENRHLRTAALTFPDCRLFVARFPNTDFPWLLLRPCISLVMGTGSILTWLLFITEKENQLRTIRHLGICQTNLRILKSPSKM